MGYFFMTFLFLGGAIICALLYFKQKDEDVEKELLESPSAWMGMGAIVCAAIWILSTIGCSVYKVDGGEARMLIQFGRPYYSESGAGLHLKRPWAESLEWITRLESFEDQIEARTSDEMIMHLDISVWWAVDPSNLEDVYSKIAHDYVSLKVGFVIPGVRSAVRDEIGKTTFSDVLTNRDKYGDSITKYVAATLKGKYILIDKIIIRNVTPPESVNAAIEQRMKSQ